MAKRGESLPFFIFCPVFGCQNYFMRKNNKNRKLNATTINEAKLEFQVPSSDPKNDHRITLLGIAFQLSALQVLAESKCDMTEDLPYLLKDLKYKLIRESRMIRRYDWTSDT